MPRYRETDIVLEIQVFTDGDGDHEIYFPYSSADVVFEEIGAQVTARLASAEPGTYRIKLTLEEPTPRALSPSLPPLTEQSEDWVCPECGWLMRISFPVAASSHRCTCSAMMVLQPR